MVRKDRANHGVSTAAMAVAAMDEVYDALERMLTAICEKNDGRCPICGEHEPSHSAWCDVSTFIRVVEDAELCHDCEYY